MGHAHKVQLTQIVPLRSDLMNEVHLCVGAGICMHVMRRDENVEMATHLDRAMYHRAKPVHKSCRASNALF